MSKAATRTKPGTLPPRISNELPHETQSLKAQAKDSVVPLTSVISVTNGNLKLSWLERKQRQGQQL